MEADKQQIKAGNGPVSLQAHTDALRIDADQTLKILSVNDAIHITAQNRIVLTAGDSQIILDGANITFKTPGDFKALSGGQDNAPGQGDQSLVPRLPKGETLKTDLHDQQFHLIYPGTEIPISDQPYRLIGEDGGLYAEGVTDANGFTERVYTSKPMVLSVEVLESDTPMVIGDKDGK